MHKKWCVIKEGKQPCLWLSTHRHIVRFLYRPVLKSKRNCDSCHRLKSLECRCGFEVCEIAHDVLMFKVWMVNLDEIVHLKQCGKLRNKKLKKECMLIAQDTPLRRGGWRRNRSWTRWVIKIQSRLVCSLKAFLRRRMWRQPKLLKLVLTYLDSPLHPSNQLQLSWCSTIPNLQGNN